MKLSEINSSELSNELIKISTETILLSKNLSKLSNLDI